MKVRLISAVASVSAATVLLAVATPTASAQGVGLSLLADAVHTGVIGVHVASPPGRPVTLGEIVAGKRRPLERLAAPTEYWDVAKLAEWRCDRRVRDFYATVRLASGEVVSATSAVRTPSCRRRLALRLPERIPPGQVARIVVRDRWRIGGVAGRLCLAAPWEALRCHGFRIRSGRRSTASRVFLYAAGSWRVELRGPDQRSRLQIPVGIRDAPRRAGPRLPRLLFTGDSMMANLDTIAGDRLRNRARVISELRFATGLSKPGFDWIGAARRDGRGHRPRAVVVFLGADEGYRMTSAAGESVHCCGADWSAEYGRRVTAMVRGYTRGRATRVFWLSQPAPRATLRADIYRAVNDGLSLAAQSSPRLTIVDVAELLTPGFVYRAFMEVDGRRVRVRERDGVHLTLAGAQLADTLVLRELARAGVLEPPER